MILLVLLVVVLYLNIFFLFNELWLVFLNILIMFFFVEILILFFFKGIIEIFCIFM